MEFVYLVIALLPIAYFSGWWVAQRKARHPVPRQEASLNPDYFKGLNYVLNEQPDKAIEVFIRMLEVDSETVETHLALGNLFRRRGEVDRAIRIHQNLIARPNLSQEQKSQALVELGLDYMRSGLLDRAEGLFNQLLDMGMHSTEASRSLLDIYQQEKDWERAIACARRLESETGDKHIIEISQFYCELAEVQMASGNTRGAEEALKKALNIDPGCVRASIQEAKLLLDARNYKAALKAYKRIEKQDSDYLPEVINPIIDCYRQLGQLPEASSYLKDLHARYGGITLTLYLTELIMELQGEEEGLKFISEALYRRPTVKGVDKLLEYTMNSSAKDIRDNLETIKGLTSNLLNDRAIYRCQKCGFDARTIHWQCPSCKSWTTIKPIQGTDGE